MPSFSPWNLLSFTVKATLSFPCSSSDPLFLAKVRLLPTLTLSHLTTWYSGRIARFLFLLTMVALAYLSTALSVALRPLFFFQQAQYAQVFLLKLAPFCTLFAGLGSINKSAIFLLFSSHLILILSSSSCSLLLSDSRFVLIIMFSPPPFLLPQSFWQELSSLSSCSIRIQWVPGHLFLPRNDAADELARRGAPLVSSAIPCSLFPLTSWIHPSFFSDWRRTVSSKFFDTQVPLISTKELVLPHHACCVLFRLCFNSQLLSSYLSRIGRIENPSCSTCRHLSQDTTHVVLHCPATNSWHRSLFGNSLSLYDLWRVSWFLVLHDLPPSPHPSEGIRYQHHQTKTGLTNTPFALCLA